MGLAVAGHVALAWLGKENRLEWDLGVTKNVWRHSQSRNVSTAVKSKKHQAFADYHVTSSRPQCSPLIYRY